VGPLLAGPGRVGPSPSSSDSLFDACVAMWQHNHVLTTLAHVSCQQPQQARVQGHKTQPGGSDASPSTIKNSDSPRTGVTVACAALQGEPAAQSGVERRLAGISGIISNKERDARLSVIDPTPRGVGSPVSPAASPLANQDQPALVRASRLFHVLRVHSRPEC
jgi:hypothetical protein